MRQNNFHVLQKPQTSFCNKISTPFLTLLLLFYYNMQDCKHPTQNLSRGQTLKSPDRLWKCWGGKRKLPSHINISVSETSVWYPSSFFHLGYRLIILLWFFIFFLPRGLTVCNVNQNLGMCERKRGERNLRGERKDRSNSSEPSDGQRWGGELPLKCRKTEMRFSLFLLPLLLLLEAPGCTDLLEVWLMNHTWALKYRGVFMACSTGAHIYLQQNSDHHNVPSSLCSACTGIQDGTLAILKKQTFSLWNKGISGIKVLKTENRKRNFYLFFFFLSSFFYQFCTCSKLRNESREQTFPCCGFPQVNAWGLFFWEFNINFYTNN